MLKAPKAQLTQVDTGLHVWQPLPQGAQLPLTSKNPALQTQVKLSAARVKFNKVLHPVQIFLPFIKMIEQLTQFGSILAQT